jgi:PAS domain S-box-containing protein
MLLNPYSVSLLAAFLMSLAVIFLLFTKKGMACRSELLYMMCAVAFWNLIGYMESSSQSLNMKIFWSVVMYIGSQTSPVFLLFFSASFTRNKRFLNKKVRLLLFIVPAVSLLFAATNEYHHLLWAQITIENTNFGVNAIYRHGPFFWIESIYSYALVIYALAMFYFGVYRFSKYYSSIFKFLICAALLPWSTNIIYSYFQGLISVDLTPITYAIASIALTFAIYKYGILQIAPVARNILFENLKDGIIVIDSSRRIIDLNRTAENMFGFNLNKIAGCSLTQAFNDLPQFTDCLCGDCQKHEAIEYNGRFFRISDSILSDGKIWDIGRMVLIHDVTEEKLIEIELKKKQEELLNAVKTKDRFFSIIAHDLKNPFQGILGYTEILKEDYRKASDEDMNLYISNLYNLAHNTSKMLENLLQWSRIQQNTMDFKPVQFDAGACISRITEIYAPTAELKKIRIISDIKIQCSIFADENMFKTIVRNLINNAVKFTKVGGTIELSAFRTEQFMEFKIKDNGVGMDANTLNGIFRIDKNISSRGTAGEEGTGLGLLLCKEFAEKNNGRIWAESYPDKGSTFYFSLPLKN